MEDLRAESMHYRDDASAYLGCVGGHVAGHLSNRATDVHIFESAIQWGRKALKPLIAK